MCVCVQLVVSPPVISSAMFVTVLKMMSTLCATCPTLAVQLLRLSQLPRPPHPLYFVIPLLNISCKILSPYVDIADTLRYLLVGSGEITLENIEVGKGCLYFLFSLVAFPLGFLGGINLCHVLLLAYDAFSS